MIAFVKRAERGDGEVFRRLYGNPMVINFERSTINVSLYIEFDS